MSHYYSVLACLLLLTLLGGLWRVLKGPSAADRMLAAQLFGTAGVGILVLLSQAYSQAALLNVALVLALLAPMSLIAFVRLSGDDR